ncbi:MAG: small multi-drug export protein [Candidatus Pacearchaeota archaeon]
MNVLLASLLLSFAPISELRAAIPLAIASKINPLVAFSLCVAINMLVAPFVFFALDKISLFIFKKSLRDHGIIKRIKKENLKKNINRYGFVALTVFVAIPLPITGAWTGSIIAWLLGLDAKKSILAISIGVLIAGIAVTFTSLGFLEILKLF